MLKIGAFEAKNTFGTLLDRVQRGEEIVITRHGQPIARLVPHAARIDQSQTQAVLQRIRDRARDVQCAKFDWDSLKELRDQGRP
ncbi:MAG: type II toxin-antitoxin system prevent-host-death family antitoxin [Terriglobales bacterium]|jgi:prevent-host-death family protein